MPKKKTPILFVDNNIAKITDKDRRHFINQYKVKQKKLKSGKIIIEMIPDKKINKQKDKLISKLSVELSKALNSQELLKDILNDINVDSLEKIDKAIKRGGTVKNRPGCYFLQIKDPRRKKPMNLRIRS